MSIFASEAPRASLERCDIVLDRAIFPPNHPSLTAADVLALIQDLKSSTGVGITKILADGTKVDKTLRVDETGLFLVYRPTLKTIIEASIFIPNISEVRPGNAGFAFNRCVVPPERLTYCLNITTHDCSPTLSFMFVECSMQVWLTALSMLMRRAASIMTKHPLKVRMVHMWNNCVLQFTKEHQEAKERGLFYSMVATAKLLVHQVGETAMTKIRARKAPPTSGAAISFENPASPLTGLNKAVSSPHTFSSALKREDASSVHFYQLHGFLASLSAPREVMYYVNKFLPNDTAERSFVETAHFLQNVIFGGLFELEMLFSAVIEIDEFKTRRRKLAAEKEGGSGGSSLVPPHATYEDIDVVRSADVSPVAAGSPLKAAVCEAFNPASILPPGSIPPPVEGHITSAALIGFYEQFQHEELTREGVASLYLSQQLFTDTVAGASSEDVSASPLAPPRYTEPFHYLNPLPKRSATSERKHYEHAKLLTANITFSFVQFCGILHDTENNSWFKPHHRAVYQDMNQPLCHYFVNSSHNTYLTGDQFASDSSTEMYRIALLRGYRCLEIDCWDGDDGKPIVYHGHTRTSRISFESVIMTINENAFITSPYPVSLSLEVHTNLHQQHLMAVNMYVIFGPKLLVMSDDDFNNIYPPNGPQGTFAYTPEALKYKIIVKSKRSIEHFLAQERWDSPVDVDSEDEEEYVTVTVASTKKLSTARTNTATGPPTTGENSATAATDFKEETDSETDGDEDQLRITAPEGATSSTLRTLRLSDVVGMPAYRCESVADRLRKCFPFEVSSFGESRALNALARERVAWIKLNKLMHSRIYPKGSRINSSNYNPQPFWNVGCQLVALNIQTYDFPLRYNEAKFEQNGRCGYILKPPFLRGSVSKQPPVSGARVSAYRGCRCYILRIKVISGHMIPRPTLMATGAAVSPQVRLSVGGVPEDESRADGSAASGSGLDQQHHHRRAASHSFTNVTHTTRSIDGNGLNPVWLEEFSFNIQCIELACLTILVLDRSSGEEREIADATIPLCSLRLGYRAVPLRHVNTNFVLRHTSLLCHFALQEV
jgi:hypothetical protein